MSKKIKSNTNENTNTSEQENTNTENTNTSEQENTNTENTNTSEQENNTQETTMENNNNNNEQEKTIAIDMYEDMINSIIELINTGYDENDGYDDIPEYHELNKKSFSLKTAIEMTDNDYIKSTLENELSRIENDMAVIRRNDKKHYYREIINAIMDKLELSNISRKSSVSKKSSVSSEKKSEYTYNMAILDNMDNEWITAKTICERIETAGKLDSVSSNPTGWKRAVSTALIGLMEKHIIECNEKHEYRKIA